MIAPESVRRSNEALLMGFAGGDAEAAREFVRRFQGRVFGLTSSILRDRQAAEDAAQETFVRAWRHAPSFDPARGSVAGWLLTIARNAAIDMTASRRAEPVPDDVLLGLDATRNADVRSRLDDDVTDSARLREALDRLPYEQRRAVVLAALYGFTMQEVAEFDEVPVGTVKTRVRLGLRKLRSDLSEPSDLSDLEVRDD